MTAKVNFVPHKIYDASFLETVEVKINFLAEVEDKYEVLKNYFYDNYKLEFDQEKFELFKIKFLRISGNNGVIALKFSRNFIQIRIERELYKSFEDTMTPYLDSIFSLMEKIEGEFERISIKKINLWPMDLGEKVDYYEVLRKLFKPNLTDNLPKEKPDGELFLSTTLNSEEDNYNIILTFGIHEKNNNNPFPTTVLDLEGICEDYEKLDLNNIKSVFKSLNQDIFNVYHWSVSDQVIEVMNGNI